MPSYTTVLAYAVDASGGPLRPHQTQADTGLGSNMDTGLQSTITSATTWHTMIHGSWSHQPFVCSYHSYIPNLGVLQ